MITYILKSSVSLIILFGLYWIFLRNIKLFVFNRFFLIFSVVLSLLLPLISVPVNFRVASQLNEIVPLISYNHPPIQIGDTYTLNDLNISKSDPGDKGSAISISAILLAFYISGVILFLASFLRNVYLLIRRSKLSEKIRLKGYQIVLTDEKNGPYCFFRNIFLNRDDYLNNKIDIELLKHEMEHVKQLHSGDIILIEVVKIFYWFNPVHILYDRAIRINHEYLADNVVINYSSDIKSYTDKLLGFIACRSSLSLTSGSNNSFTRMRLIMMLKPGSGRLIYGTRIAFTVCVGVLLFLLLSFKESDKESLQSDKSAPENLQINKTDSTQIGVSQELLKEYQDIIELYKRTIKNGKEGYFLNFTPAEKARLESIFFQMSKEQQTKQMFVFIPSNSMVLKKVVPTTEQIESFKDPKVYGVWIDGARVNNESLNKYRNTDFSYVFSSKLAKNATNYGKHIYQVDLMTNSYYQNYYNKTISDKSNTLVPRVLLGPRSDKK